MKGKVFLLLIVSCLVFFVPVLQPAGRSADNVVYVIPVTDEIAPGWLKFLERALEEAEDAGARAVILELDTPGGYINTAMEARKMLEKTSCPVYAYVNPHALSAGAYLALSADRLYMSPSSTIGAAEPRVLGQSEAVDEKTLSMWEAEMRSVAERQGKDSELAAAMVRREMAIDGVVSGSELLTLTAQEAERLQFSDKTVHSLSELLEDVELADAGVVTLAPSTWEIISGWLINPLVATIILTLAFLCLVIEVLTAGFGVAGLLSILFFGLYFGGHFFTGVSGWPAIFLFVLGVVLLLVEAFIPGFGVFGVGGLVAVSVSIVLSSVSAVTGLRTLLLSFLLSGVAGYLAFKYFQRKGILRRFIHQESFTRELGYSSSTDLSYLKGRQGVTMTPLRPSGIVNVDGSRLNVVSEGGFIPAGEPVEVYQVEGNRIVVRSVKKGE